MRARIFVAMGLLIVDVGLFVLTSVFLPRRGSFGFSGPWSHFVNSRDRWDIAWGTLVAAFILSVGLFLLLEGLGVLAKRQK